MLRAIPLIKVKLHTFKYCLFFSPILLVKCLLKKKKKNQQLTVRKEMREGALSRPGTPSVQAAAGFSTPLLRVSAQL